MDVKIASDLCRICMNDASLQSIHISPEIDLSSKIMACASVNVSYNDPLPHMICNDCVQSLEIAYRFKIQCELSDKEFRKYVEDEIETMNDRHLNYSSIEIHVQPLNREHFSVIHPFECLETYIIPDHSNNEENLRENKIEQGVSSNLEIDDINCDDIETSNEIIISNSVENKENDEECYTDINSLMSAPIIIEENKEEVCTSNSSNEISVDQNKNNEFQVIVEHEEISQHKNENNEKNQDCTSLPNAISVPLRVISSDKLIDPVNKSKTQNNRQRPKGRHVVIKSIIKPEHVHYVSLDNYKSKNQDSCVQNPNAPIEDEVIYDHENIEYDSFAQYEIPEPAIYLEAETTSTVNVEVHNTYTKNSVPKKKIGKYKPPEGVSYLRSGRGTVKFPVGRPRTKKKYTYMDPKKVEAILQGRSKSDSLKPRSNYNSMPPMVRRARVAKISLPIHFPPNKYNLLKQKFSTNKNSSQKQQLAKQIIAKQQLETMNNVDRSEKKKQAPFVKDLKPFKPPVTKTQPACDVKLLLSPKVIIENNDTDVVIPKKTIKNESVARNSSISDDLEIIRSGFLNNVNENCKPLQTIEQDIEEIKNCINPLNASNENLVKDGTKTNEKNEKIQTNGDTVKQGRHTAIKSKQPKKRKHLSSETSTNAQKIEIEIIPRKSGRQRSPKKIFPEFDFFTSPKKKEKNSSTEDERSQQGVNGEKNERSSPLKEANTNENFVVKYEKEDEEEIEQENDDSAFIKTECLDEQDLFRGMSRLSDSSSPENENIESEPIYKHDGYGSDMKRKRTRIQVRQWSLQNDSSLSCDVCHKSFPYRSHLIRHVRTHTGLKPHSCSMCRKSYTSLASLKTHMKHHTGDYRYICRACGRGFAQPSVLKRHMLSHTGVRQYRCDICYKYFTHDSSLRTHLKMHTVKEPQHQCDICDKKFKYMSTLTSHIKTHSGIKPFTCPECRKAFYRMSLLKRHLRSHTKERPYKCKLCRERFAYSGGLASHMKLHTGVRPYPCTLCEYSFFRMSHLKNHMSKIHNDGYVMECNECNLQFESKPIYRQHMNEHTRPEVNDENGENDDEDDEGSNVY